MTGWSGSSTPAWDVNDGRDGAWSLPGLVEVGEQTFLASDRASAITRTVVNASWGAVLD